MFSIVYKISVGIKILKNTSKIFKNRYSDKHNGKITVSKSLKENLLRIEFTLKIL